ncbi:glycosyltransferase family 2 protein [Actinacidiphila sp. bgisy160]|uniref:glycosyltransferase family 2 protein n=1 Tax=Actinacidiphila sp. bgisy160 TaxID=3413796 RepID=UPI003D7032DB
MATPDVSVIVAVYNTMPYLSDCLTSLVEQTIGRDRLEIVAVNDGSTDDSGKELDRFADLYPGTVKVIHQANSGGPAAPSNRALDVATGRYVYFIGSDDYLGREALERMVAAADEHGSDVVVGKMEGVGGRYVHQALYETTRHDVTFTNSALPWTIANTKLFRRELVERYELRFPEDLPVGSDQPFTIEACVRAARISVLADYTYYYAVKRGDSSNITYRADHEARLRCTAEIMHFTAGLVPAGPERDAVLKRHFGWELSKLLLDDFPELDPVVQKNLVTGIGRLADAYLTGTIRDGMGVKKRVRLGLAQRGRTDELVALIRDEAEHGAPGFVLEGERAFARYPGFRDVDPVLPMSWYELLGEGVHGRLKAGTKTLSAAWHKSPEGPALAVSARTKLLGPFGAGPAPVRCELSGPQSVPLPATTSTWKNGLGTRVDVVVPLRPLVAMRPGQSARWRLNVAVDLAGEPYRVPFGAHASVLHKWIWRRARPYRVSVTTNEQGRLVLAVAADSILRGIARRLRRPRKK